MYSPVLRVEFLSMVLLLGRVLFYAMFAVFILFHIFEYASFKCICKLSDHIVFTATFQKNIFLSAYNNMIFLKCFLKIALRVLDVFGSWKSSELTMHLAE